MSDPVITRGRIRRSHFVECARSPHIAAGRGETTARKAAIARLRKFRADYREAMDRWVGGDREVLFPSGTYWMRVNHGAAVAPFD